MFAKAFVGLLLCVFTSHLFAAQVPPGFTDRVFVGGLDQPTACEFAPDGRLFILGKRGTVRIFKNGQLLPGNALSIEVNDISERGLLGIAFDPDFSNNHFLYLYYTTPSNDPKNRVSRFTVTGDTIDRGSEIVLVDAIRSDAGNHNAGWIQFGNDGKLYIATGDGGRTPSLAQNLNSINGKILRINKDGSIPADNPFFGQTGTRGEIFCYGLRNPWRFRFDSLNDTLFIGDVGQNTFEEVNIGRRGANYGWPNAEGTSSNSNFTNPIFTYNHNNGSASITGGLVYRGTTFPEAYRGAYFFGDYVQGFIRYLKLTASSTVESVNEFSPDAGNVVHITTGPDGALYYVDIGGQTVHRVQFGSGTNTAPVAKAKANRRFGPLPLTVTFTAEESFDPDGNPIRFRWDFGDGTSSTLETVTKQFSTPSNFNVQLTVADSKRASTPARMIKIFAGDRPPVPVITRPQTGTSARPGQTVRFAGSASDPEDGALDPSRLTWTVVLHHNDHTHPFLGPLTGVSGGSFVLPVDDHTDGSVFFRIRLKARDSRGLTITRFVDVVRE